MHGVLKVRTTEEQRLKKQKEQEKKLAAYSLNVNRILASRSEDRYISSDLQLCALILSSNPDVYTLWNYRKEAVLIEIKAKECGGDEGRAELVEFLENEIKLTEQCLLSNPKSYGAWHHRFWVLERHPEPKWQKEFDLCTKYLTYDDRNFHCWDYRRLIINKIGISLEDELRFSTDRINVDFSNYSSWHYRSTLRTLDQESLDGELTLIQNAVFTDPSDSSAWFYLKWVLSNSEVTNGHREKFLDALDQLLELEPDCKWVWVAKCWILDELCKSDEKYTDNRIQYYKKLENLDPLRSGRYQDLIKQTTEKRVYEYKKPKHIHVTLFNKHLF